MPRKNSTAWNIADPITAVRLNDFNQDLDDLYENGDDRLRIVGNTGLEIEILPGYYRVASVEGFFAGDIITLANNSTNYVMLDDTGTIQVSTTAWDIDFAKLAKITTLAGVITNIEIAKIVAIGGDLAALNIVGLTEKTTLVDGDLFVISDSEDNNINKKVSKDTIENKLHIKSTKSTFVAGENISAGNPVRFGKSVSGIVSNYGSITNQAQPADNATIFSFVAELNKINSITLRKFSNYNTTSGTVFLEIRNSANTTLLYTSSSSGNVADGTYVPFTFTGANLVVGTTYNVRIQFTPYAWWGFYTGTLGYYRSFNYDNIEDNTKLYKSSALYYFTAQIDGFATNTVNSGDNVIIDTTGINNNQTGLTAGLVYYLANTPGTISTTPGTNLVIVGKAVSTTGIEIYLDSINQQTLITPTVGASPYTYQNTTGRPVVVSITGGTISQVAISRDNTNFYQTARATNTFVYLGINDYVKITYSVAPVLKTFTF